VVEVKKAERTYIVGHEVGEVDLRETLAKEVAHMTKTEEDEITYVGSEKDIIRRLFYGVLLDRFSIIMFRDTTVGLVGTVTKL